LVAFDSCGDALSGLKAAAKEAVTPWGFPGDGARAVADATGGIRMPAAASAREESAPGSDTTRFSGTNTHEAGVDEPDLVKTDGRRIVTVTSGVLRVVDAATRTLAGSVDLSTSDDGPSRYVSANLLLQGDRALVLTSGWPVMYANPTARFAPGPASSRLVMVDLAGARPAIVGSYSIDGTLVDARQVGATARVVVRSAPRIEFPYKEDATDAQRLAANRATIDKSTIDDWLPRYEVEAGGDERSGAIDCGALRRPEIFSGTSMLTVLSFDLTSPGPGVGVFGSGDPATIVADGDLVYSNGASLYVANDQRWRAVARPGTGARPFRPQDVSTEIYRFDTSASGPPNYVAAGSVPGTLVNQYAMSEYDGHLRVAATVSQSWDGTGSSSSTVHVLRANDMAHVGSVGGLGKGERIYSVRFVGPIGYVVTFRQTDPLYAIDLHDPAKPTVRGELKINGYSAYLHPVDSGRLLGIGQDADSRGRVKGTQVSLFDVSDLSNPRRVAQHRVRFGSSEAEFDPHAFLYWPDSGLLVVPLATYTAETSTTGALVLRVEGSTVTEVGTVRHPSPAEIRRSLLVDGVLWTVSETGMRATDATSLRSIAWLPFT